MIKAWSDRAWEEYLYWQEKDKSKARKINELLKVIERGDGTRLGKAERLKGWDGYCSVHIDKSNRLIYKIEDDKIIIVQCKTHYDDK